MLWRRSFTQDSLRYSSDLQSENFLVIFSFTVSSLSCPSAANHLPLLHKDVEGQRDPEALLHSGRTPAASSPCSSSGVPLSDGLCISVQNIDTLERVAGLEKDDLIEAHGTFYTSHCVSFCCRKEYSLEWMKGLNFTLRSLAFRPVES